MAAKDEYDRMFNGDAITMSVSPPKRPDSELGDGEDLGPCCSRPGNKLGTVLHVHSGGDPVQSFQYAHISVRSVFTPTQFWIVFAANEVYKITVTGRNLWQVYNYITQHRLEFIRKADRDFGHMDGKPVITAIEIKQLETRE